jgi:ATP-binding cassette subfamily F protein 3
MGTIRLQNAGKQFGPRVVLADVSLELHTGQIAALVGANGVGKTTLFRLITGELAPDAGTVTRTRGLEVGYLPQEPDIAAGATLHDAVAEAVADVLSLEHKLAALAESIAAERDAERVQDLMAQYDRQRARFEAAGGYQVEQRINEVLGGLGFEPADYDLPIAVLSGGQKCRAALAKLLLRVAFGGVGGPPFLLLDEPTNHLDIDAVQWLEKFLAGHHGGAVIVSHDRYLLDRLAERTIEIVPPAAGRGAQVHSCLGNYSAYVQARALRHVTALRQYEHDQALIAKEQAFIARHIASKRTEVAKGRRTRLERRLGAGELATERPAEQQTFRLRFAEATRKVQRGKELVRLAGLRKQYGDKVLFDDLELIVHAGERLGITGPNGTGKTTLLRIILGEVRSEAGSVYVAPTARIGYFAQEPAELDPGQTIVDAICELRPDFLERDARNYAARFLFTDEDPFKKIGQLSGGEQSRVRFMKLILTAPDVLILDEPTNHLDIPSREALEQALLEFAGTVVTVSHDRYFLDRVVDKLLVMRTEGVQLYHGNYSYYIEQVERVRAEEEAARAAARDSKAAAARGAGAAARGKRKPPKPGGPRSPLLKLTLAELEAYIAEREGRLAKVQERFGDPRLYRDVAAVNELRAEYDALREELAAAEAMWLERAEDA